MRVSSVRGKRVRPVWTADGRPNPEEVFHVYVILLCILIGVLVVVFVTAVAVNRDEQGRRKTRGDYDSRLPR
ncbi:hypothetical protein [Plantibacter sp. M259]|uniref:hypothetical protein n=1 Tax=Plantibacter sp. M259 TaxID=2583822 RepID=UPI00111068B9|nr:hypothetical protein [Plantibacter sp. M259]